MSGGKFVCFVGATFVFGTHGIVLVASYRFRAYLAGMITVLATSSAVVFYVEADGTRGRDLALEIGNTDL